MNASGRHPKEWTEEAMYSVGLPIILGGLSTIIAVIPGWFMNYVIFNIFYKIIFLAIVFGVLHALLFLPTFMALIGPKNFVLYQPNDRLSFIRSFKRNSVQTDKGDVKITDVSTRRSQCESNVFQEPRKCFNQLSQTSQEYTNDSHLESKTICMVCKNKLKELNDQSPFDNFMSKSEGAKYHTDSCSVSDLGSSLEVNSVITSISGITESEDKSNCCHSIATLDVNALKESYC